MGAREYLVDPMLPDDADQVLAIYADGIATGNATFQTDVPSWEEWDANHLGAPRLVARTADGRVLGWCALSPISRRPVYAGVAEVSVYVSAAARGRGVGRALLQATVQASEDAGLWTLQAGIFSENAASIALHAACGFRIVGTRERMGRHLDRWRDVTLMERRSRVVGTDD